MKIYGHPGSTCTRKVLTTLAETQTPHEFILVDLAKGEHKQPAHTARQPFGRIPTIDDDGFTMFESRAICRYIDDKTGRKLTPSDARGRALAEQWISIETSEFTPHAMKFIFHHVFKRPQDEAVLASAGTSLEKAASVMESHLASHQYLAGSQFSLGDLVFLPYVEYAMMTPAKDILAKHPNVLAWWTRVSERPSWKKVAGR